MNSTSNPVRSRSASFVHFLMLVWLLVLSVAAILGYRLMLEVVSEEQVETGLRQLDGLESRVTELTNSMQLLQVQPEAATLYALEDTRQTLGARVEQLEQALADRVAAADLNTLRIEIEQLKARSTIVQAVSPTPPPAPVSTPTRTKPAATAQSRKVTFPYRVLGAELRAGQPALSIAPATGTLTTEEIQVLLPGESVGRWRLETIDSNSAVFRAGEQTRRVVIP
jgi:hypothetical protein